MPQQDTRIRLCGRMLVHIKGRPISIDAPKERMLLAYLIANRSRELRRDELVDALWEDEPPATAGSGLSPMMSRLRREKLGDEILPPKKLSLQLPADAWIDVELVEQRAQQTLQALKEGRPAEAVESASEALDLLEDEFLPDLEATWIDARRRELDDRRLSLLRASVDARLQLGGEELEPAERAARELVERAPYRESGHKLLMEVLAARGDVAEAHVVYDRLRRLLMDELGKTPDPAITELNAELLEGAPREPVGPARIAAARAPDRDLSLPPLLDALRHQSFVGRREAIERLCRRWEQVSIKPRVAAITGEPGIGKTRLAACFSHTVHRDGCTVLYGRCYEDPLTYQPFVEAVGYYAGACDLRRELPDAAEQLSRYLPALHHVVHGVQPTDHRPGPQDRYALFEAIAEVLRHAAGRRPLLLVVDDIHWADAATFDLLVHAIQSLPPSRSMFVVTSRAAADPGAARETESLEARLAALRHEADVEHISLEGLDPEETATLIDARSEVARGGDFASRMWRRTGGHPLFIEEMLSLVGAEEEPDLGRLGVPEPVKHAIIRRLERLGEDSRKVLARAAVIGPEFPLSLLAAVLGESEDSLLDELEALIRYGLVVEVPDKPDQFAFSHALVRETQYGTLSASRRARLHLEVGRELERIASTPGGGERVTPAELANHFYEARSVVEPERAAEHAIHAAKDAESSAAYQQASTQYDRAIELLRAAEADERRVCVLLIAQGKARLRAGELAAARDEFREAAAIARRTGEAEQLAQAALGFHGRYTAAAEVHKERIALLQEALDTLDGGDSPLRARVLARLGDAVLWSAPGRGRELSTEAVRMADRLGNARAQLEALAAMHTALLDVEDHDERLELSRQRLKIARESGSDEAIAASLRWHIHDLCELGDMRSAKHHYAELGRLADRLAQPLYLSYARHWECVFAQLHGRLEEAERLADDAYQLARRAGAMDAEMSRVDKRAAIYREQGRLPVLRAAIERFATEVPQIKAWWALLALVEAESGDPASARAHVDRLLADDAAALPRDVFWLYALSLLAETCALLEDAAEPASVVYGLLGDHANRHVQVGIDTFRGSVSRFLGLAATTCADWDAAETHFTVAEARHEEMDSPPLLARTHLDHAWMLSRRGDAPSEASRLLDSAEAIATEFDLEATRIRARALRADIAAGATPV